MKNCPNCDEELDKEMINAGVCDHCGETLEDEDLDEDDEDTEDDEESEEEDGEDEDDEEDEEEDGEDEDDDEDEGGSPRRKKGPR